MAFLERHEAETMTKRNEEDFFEIHVSGGLAGLRLDQVLASRVSRRLARRLIEAGAVFVDRRRVKVASRIIPEGAVVRAPFFLPEKNGNSGDVRILLETADYVVADKPAGQATAPTLQGESSLFSELQEILGPLWVVSRLDFHTSGLVPFVRNPKILHDFEQLLRSGDCIKEYTAITPLHSFASRILDFPLAADPHRTRRFCVHPKGRPARTEILEVIPLADGGRQMVRLRLHTGRTHQIRVHLAHAGAPVCGDPWYPAESPAGRGPLLLHASRLAWVSERFGTVDLRSTPPWLADLMPPGHDG